MSEFINKARIAELNQSNAELNSELESLKKQVADQDRELEDLREKQEADKCLVEEQIMTCEKNESDQSHLTALSRAVAQSGDISATGKQFVAILRQMNASPLATAIEKYYRRKQRPRVVVAFLAGALLASLVLAGH